MPVLCNTVQRFVFDPSDNYYYVVPSASGCTDSGPGATSRKGRGCKAVDCAVDLRELEKPYCLKKGEEPRDLFVVAGNDVHITAF
jgi:hypothetical protein